MTPTSGICPIFCLRLNPMLSILPFNLISSLRTLFFYHLPCTPSTLASRIPGGRCMHRDPVLQALPFLFLPPCGQQLGQVQHHETAPHSCKAKSWETPFLSQLLQSCIWISLFGYLVSPCRPGAVPGARDGSLCRQGRPCSLEIRSSEPEKER